MSHGDSRSANQIKQTHPIRGLLWGIPFGLGLALILVVTTVIPLELAQILIVAVVGMAVGALWGIYGPARKPKGSRPAPQAVPPPAAPAPSESEDATEEAGEAGTDGEPEDSPTETET